ncbi:helix-turn-helix domain-containing protein [Pleionea sediminis]|uniref:helix-turn-helix domain-containing protein n=1 Tax=Pleionea sediminis TaxID=2569479 RepID=UPI0013DE5DE9|nr:helix-turn-helix domain-containing protein [Pleionea sediminis]
MPAMNKIGLILESVAESLKRERLEQNLSQQQVAEVAGISRRTLVDAETGKNISLATLVKVLIALKAEDRLESLMRLPDASPVELAKLKGKQRQRASGSRVEANDELTEETKNKPSNESDKWTW